MPVFEPRRMRLQSRILLYFLSLTVGAVALVVFLVDSRKTQILMDLNRDRGMAIARSLEAAASSELLSYNYVSLQQLADRSVQEEGVAYVIILDKEGMVAGYSGLSERQGQPLEDLVSRAGHASRETFVQRLTDPFNGLDISVPVYVEGSAKKWGTVRVGLSLESVHAESKRTRLSILGFGLLVLLLALVVARELSRRITGPLGRLVLATDELARGNYDHRVRVATGDEIEHLAVRFNEMAHEIRRQQVELGTKNQELAALNATLEAKVRERTRALAEAEEKYRILVEFSPDPICIFQNGRLVFFNRALGETFGYSMEEVADPAFDIQSLIAPEHHELFQLHLKETGEGASEEDRSREVLGRRRDGSVVHLDLRSTRIRLSGKPAIETLLVDITEQRQLQEKMVSYERLSALGEMASGVAHDFNNILGTILARAQFLQAKTRDDEVLRGLRIIEKAAEDGGATVRRIQDFSRVRADRNFRRVGMEALLEDVVEMTRNTWEDRAQRQGRRIEVAMDVPRGLAAWGDVHELREVFVNLVINAVDAIDADGTIRIAAAEEHEAVLVRVSDTGHGMSPEVQRRLFDPFFSTKGVKGTGLGMSIVYGIVTRHGGDIRVESAPGEGTSFILTLPRAVEAEIDEVVELLPGAAGTGRILVVDDEEAIRALAADILREAGYDVQLATGGAEAIAALRGDDFDLVVTDLGMPDVTGWDVVDAVREMDRGVRVVLLTGWGATLDPEELTRRGIDCALAKPFRMQDLLRTVGELIVREPSRRTA